jgi:hypothetical protein
VKTPDGGHQITALVDCAATLDFVYDDFVRRFVLHTRKCLTKTPVRLANGQRVTSSTVCDITFELARHEFQRNFYVLRDLRGVDVILGLPWLDDEHASLLFGSTMVFTLLKLNFFTTCTVCAGLHQIPYVPVAVFGPSQLCHTGNLQVMARPLTTLIQPLPGFSGLYSPPGSVQCGLGAACIQGRAKVQCAESRREEVRDLARYMSRR